MTSEILKVKKRFGYPPDFEETPLLTPLKYVTKKKGKLLDFSFLQKIKTHYQILEKIKKRSLVKL